MSYTKFCRAVALAALPLLGCDGQQYVSPDTALLTITSTDTGSTRVRACNYVPVLLGSRIEAEYAIESSLSATIVLTRVDIDVTFQGFDPAATPFHTTAKQLAADDNVADEDPPVGFDVSLSTGCTVEEP